MAAMPTVPEVREWAGVADEDITDLQIELILYAEADLQAAYCTFWPINFDYDNDDMPDPLAQALLRRCARTFAARGLPLGSLPLGNTGMGGEYGTPRNILIPRLDAEIERYEFPYTPYGKNAIS